MTFLDSLRTCAFTHSVWRESLTVYIIHILIRISIWYYLYTDIFNDNLHWCIILCTHIITAIVIIFSLCFIRNRIIFYWIVWFNRSTVYSLRKSCRSFNKIASFQIYYYTIPDKIFAAQTKEPEKYKSNKNSSKLTQPNCPENDHWLTTATCLLFTSCRLSCFECFAGIYRVSQIGCILWETSKP